MSQENLVCPLCMEDLDIDDLTFIPCTCGYQICRFCWHRIRTAESGTCPACRKPYTEGPAQFKPLSTNEINQLKKNKKLKESEEKKKNIEKSLQFFASARVIQKNLMFVVGLPSNITEFELRKQENFGKFGKINKVTLTRMAPPSNNNNNTSISQHSNSQCQSAYVMFARIEDTLQAIKALNSSQHQFGKSIKASLGTTKYCSRFTKGQQCLKSECMYLHEAVDEEACFTKEEIQQGKHIAYEQKLFSIYCKQDEICLRTPSPSTANQDNHLLPGRVEKVTTGIENKQNGKGRESPKQSKTIKPATTESTTQPNPSKPATVVQTHCWTVSGATIVKSNLKPRNATGQTTTSITKNGLLINNGSVNLQKLGDKDKKDKSFNNKTKEKELQKSEAVTAPCESARTSISSNDNNNNDMTSELPEVRDDASSRTSADEDFSNPPSEDGLEGKMLEKVPVPSPVDSEEAQRSLSCEEELQGDDEEEDVSSTNDSNVASNERLAELELEIGLRQSPNLDENITKSEHFLAGEEFDSPLGRSPVESFFDGIASTPHTKGALPPSNLLDISDIEVEVADLKVEESTNSLDCSKDDDRHDDDIDPWKIVSLQLDMINNERILEEGPLYCQTSTSFLQMEAERSMLGSCGFQENRPSHFQQFFNNCHDQPLLSSSDMAMTSNRSFRQQDILEDMDRQRQQQRMQLIMQQQQQFMNGARAPIFPPVDSKPGNPFYSDLPNCMPYLGLQDQQRPVPMQDQYSSAHVHHQMQQQQMHRQHYLYMQKLQQQQLELANQRLHPQFMPPSTVFNGQHLVNNNALLSGNNQVMARQQQQQQLKQLHEQQNMSQVLPNEQKRWQDGLKAMLPNVNISFGPSPPFVKENQNPPTKQPALTNGDVFLDTSMRNGDASNGSMHEVACLDPAIVNAGAVANYSVPSSYNTNLMVQQQQQQQQHHMGFNYSMSNYQRLQQQQESVVHRSFDWQGQTNGISDVPQHVPLFARGVPGVPPPPGFEKLHPSRKEHM